jgi:Uma2 family endonuclease
MASDSKTVPNGELTQEPSPSLSAHPSSEDAGSSPELVEQRLAQLAAGWLEATSELDERVWPPAQGAWTLEDWRRLTGGCWRYEVIDGVLHMTPPPEMRHQTALSALSAQMWLHAHQHQLGIVLASFCSVLLPSQPVPVQPDLLFVRAERLDILTETQVQGAPDLVVEILSPSNTFYARREKYALYQDAGVAEYWIVDLDLQTIQVFVLEDGKYSTLGWWGLEEKARSQILAGFTILLIDLFT